MYFLGKNIKYLRKTKEISQTKLAEELEMTRDAVASLEIDRAQPSFETLIKIRNYLTIKIHENKK